ncbi:MAG: imidazoleglycerol-phosphate dehydratase HisB [Cyanobacteria bacterium]|nr:imidazoleglycerol-phosphate dehydratase HisB [Cyanobacteriota bacterium]
MTPPEQTTPALRTASVSRESRETQISITVNLDQPGQSKILTPVPFFTHMLETLAVHGRMSLMIDAKGDIEVDPHHLVEDCGIVLGQAMAKALGSFNGIQRAGCFAFPMDATLAVVSLDLCGRANLVWNVDFTSQAIGSMDPRLFREFFKGFIDGMRITFHAHIPCQDNDHHLIEAIFKAFARSLRQALTPLDENIPLSTKGSFD